MYRAFSAEGVRSVLVGGVSIAALFSAADPALAQAASSEGAALSVEDIVVTARRKEEKNQDVPVAVTAFSSERIAEMNIVSTQGLQSSVPSLVVGPNGQGSRNVESPTIRGQGATFQASPGVVVYLDEVPLPATLTLANQGGPGNYLDLSNVQVLKGPQGTLFGRNTTGGAVLLQPNKPSSRQEGYVQVQGGNYNDRELQAMVNVPLADDKLLVRFAGEIVDRDGYTEDVAWNKNRDDKHYWTGRLGIIWRPNEKVENYLMVYDTWSRNNGTALVNRGFNLGYYQLAGICDTVATGPCSSYQDIVDAEDARGPRKVAFSVDAFQKMETWSATDTLDWQLTDSTTLRNIVNYAELKNYYAYDNDGSLATVNDVNLYTGRSIPRDDIKQYSEELQLQGRAFDKRLDYVVGAFYFRNKPNGRQQTGAVSLCPLGLGSLCVNYPGTNLSTGDGSPFNAQSVYGVDNESYAVYAQGSYDLGGFASVLDGLKLTLGYRYTWDKVAGFSENFVADPAGYVGRDAIDHPEAYRCSWKTFYTDDPAGDCTYRSTLKTSRPTWTAGLDYKLKPNLLVYGKVSRGYKAGGFNTYSVQASTQTFSPEIVTAYELGFKSDFNVSDVPVRLNVDVFQTDYDKIQRAAGDYNPVTRASGAQILGSPSARIRGVEIETVVRPTKYLEAGLNYSYLDAEYTKFDYTVTGFFPLKDCSNSQIPPGGTADLSCVPLYYLSPNILNAYTRINFRDNLSLFLNYAWTDTIHTTGLVPPASQPGEALDAYGLLSASLDWKHVGGSQIDLSVFGTNLTDEEYRISNSNIYQTGSLGAWATIYGEPRMVGIRARYNWGS